MRNGLRLASALWPLAVYAVGVALLFVVLSVILGDSFAARRELWHTGLAIGNRGPVVLTLIAFGVSGWFSVAFAELRISLVGPTLWFAGAAGWGSGLLLGFSITVALPGHADASLAAFAVIGSVIGATAACWRMSL